MSNTLDSILKLCLILMFAYAMWSLLGNPVSNIIRDIVRKDTALRKARAVRQKQSSKLIQHISRILKVVRKKEMPQEPYIFLIGTILIFVVTFLMLLNLEGLFKSLIASCGVSLLPYIILQIKLRMIRVDGSYEGTGLVTSIINNYKQNSFNMIEAVDRTACSNQISFFSKSNLLRLSLALKSYRNEEELDDAVKTFVFAYNTEWSILLGMNIKISVFDGTDVCTSMEDILTELKSVSEIIEANKRYNNESFSMIKFMLIPLYLFTVYICMSAFGFSLKKYIQYQFFTSIGLNTAIITFLSIAICFLVYSMVRRPKYDI